MKHELIARLSPDESHLIAPELQEAQELRSALAAVEGRLARLLAMRCPEFLRDPSVAFDRQQMVFYRVVEEPQEPQEAEPEAAQE